MIDLGQLNPQQLQAVKTINGPLMVLAGAGTGKTRVITYRIAHMISEGIAPSNILAVTFTNKAAREMQERVCSVVVHGGAKSKPLICTFHSFCVRILRLYIHKLGYKPNFVIYDESDQIGVIKKILSGYHTKGQRPDPAKILSLISKIKNYGSEYISMLGDQADLCKSLLEKYQSVLRSCNAVDFDDLIGLVIDLFKNNEDVLNECQDKYRYIIVDEYQDTNKLQFKLLNYLAARHKNICVVGDDDQSIYAWRGAQISNIKDFEHAFTNVKIIKLEQNYRSTNTILEAANHLIRNNTSRYLKRLWSQKGSGEKILIAVYDDENSEAEAIARRIEYDRLVNKIPWSKQAVLFRTNAQSRAIEMALRKSGIRYKLVGGYCFFNRREIKDIIAYLKVLVNPDDDVSLLRIANVPPRGISESSIRLLLQKSHENHCSVFQVMCQSHLLNLLTERTRSKISEFVSSIENLRQTITSSESLSLSKCIHDYLVRSGYLDDLTKSEKDPELASSRVNNVLNLVNEIDNVSCASNKPLEKLEMFLDELSLDFDREDEMDNDTNNVTLITMHSCKGLEFPVVNIVGMEEGLLPHAHSLSDGTIEEERRLFYVAITRAMELLRISYCRSRKKANTTLPSHPSRFLKELPSSHLEYDDPQTNPATPEVVELFFEQIRKSIGQS